MSHEIALLRMELENTQMSLDNWIAASAAHAVRVGELERENAALREDKARLDYLQEGIKEDLRAALDAERKEVQP